MARTSLVAAVSLIALAALGFSSSNGIASRGPVSVSDLAPADEYFGREHLSPLGIRHKIFSLKDDLHHGRVHPDVIQHDASFIEDALQDWLGRFPRDPWLPATAWNLATLYEELPGGEAQQHAVTLLHTVRDRFSDTAYAAYAARDLQRGVGVRDWPRWAGTPPSAHASPSARPPAAHPSPSGSPSVSPQPSGSPQMQATAAPPSDPQTLVQAILLTGRQTDPVRALLDAQSEEERYRALSHSGADPAYARAAWELAALYQRLPGEDARKRSIRLLALLVDRFPDAVYGRWALRDLERGIGTRT